PYRKVRGLLESDPNAWFPWGYRTITVAESQIPREGDLLDLWEIDDIYDPVTAEPVVVAKVDYVSITQDYLAFTLEAAPDLQQFASRDEVLHLARNRILLGEVAKASTLDPVL